VSEPDASLLARRTRLLLRCYPKAYRAHRGEEIFGTLLVLGFLDKVPS